MTDDREPQNVYDDPTFFAGYAQLDRFGSGWTNAMEHHDLLGLLPDVRGSRVVDLGCGVGQLARHLAERGAAEVVGIDVSERMLALARSEQSHPHLTYRRQSIEDVAFPPDSLELVVSSLAFHYVADYPELVRRIAGWLTTGGVLVFSTEHPIYTATGVEDAWVRDDGGAPTHWALDSYAEEGLREKRWFVDGVRKYHRTMATLLNGIVEAGLIVERVVEPTPSADALRRRPDWVHERQRPTFLLVRARKP